MLQLISLTKKYPSMKLHSTLANMLKETGEVTTSKNFSIVVIIILLVLFKLPINAQTHCKEEALLQLPDVTITSITHEKEYAPHCKVSGIIGKEIRFELLLPEKWNGKFVMGGGGGFVGSVVNVALSYGAVQSGYATIGTDTGHEGHPLDASWAYNNMERIVNFGHMAVHRTAVTGKALVQAYYNQEITRSYFVGCSRGGGQALMEAQRYPEDFDGIVAGAPAYNWTHGLAAGTIQIMQAMYPDPSNIQEPVLGPKAVELIESSYLDQCDELDGIKDGILNDPRACAFELESLLCVGEKTDQCLTEEELLAAKAIYDGPRDREGELFYGFPFGGETDEGGWTRWLTGGLKYMETIGEFQGGLDFDESIQVPVTPNAHYAFGNGIMKNMIYHESTWTYENYNFDNFHNDARLLGNTLNAASPDLSEFRKNGGKLLMYTGWSDAAISPLGTIGYYENVIAHDESAKDDVRLFMMPGVLHCIGGEGPSWVNWIDELDKWVDQKESPDQITVYYLDEKNQVAGSRLLCSYPKIASYDGKGDTRNVSSFSCVEGE